MTTITITIPESVDSNMLECLEETYRSILNLFKEKETTFKMSSSKEPINKIDEHYTSFETEITKVQAIIRGKLFRKKRLPNSLFTIQKILQKRNIKLCKTSDDGRVNSCMDEDEIIQILTEEIPHRIYKPDVRMWYDILIYDYQYGLLPVNIKTTTTLTNDNTGNLAMCVYAYTDEDLDLKNKYQNGRMSEILIEKLKQNDYNYNDKKDYYFVVVNKENNKDIIINSVKGLTELTPNINNLPFQVCWNKNRYFNYKNINKNVKLLIESLQKPKPSWKEIFMSDLRKLK